MNRNSNIRAALKPGQLQIQVFNAGNFRAGAILQRFTDEWMETEEGEHTGSILIDLSHCDRIDSTFAGVLTYTSLRLKKQSHALIVTNVSPCVMATLNELGIQSLFRLSHESIDESAKWQDIEEKDTGDISKQKVMLDAHTILGTVCKQNQARFKDVIEALQADLPEKELS